MKQVKVEVISTVDEIRHEEIFHKTVIIIDVLRASSTIVTALSKGYEQVIPVETIGQAQSLQSETAYLAGERYGKKIQGFDFSNSPTEIMAESQIRPTLILTTTNGTKAIQKAKKGESVLIGCLMNAKACADKALAYQRDITILCAGSRQLFAL